MNGGCPEKQEPVPPVPYWKKVVGVGAMSFLIILPCFYLLQFGLMSVRAREIANLRCMFTQAERADSHDDRVPFCCTTTLQGKATTKDWFIESMVIINMEVWIFEPLSALLLGVLPTQLIRHKVKILTNPTRNSRFPFSVRRVWVL